ncbi:MULTISPECIES: heparinase II/III domain-containing protein [unclassified Streptomyces]|uniref:heparinase II/III domain-containing protein n=1 Tax=unclassified Streptomyces TaxID=2593676 RepID=UPI002555C40C|nr:MULTISPECIES: heparinase II/III family protein [unclassified Streptomyces]WRZ62964.1 heparinase II/III-family protein [Streptomyces sp. NBC_01257]
MAALRRIARERGGWWHAYVCPAHGVELDHGDVLAGEFPEGGARCAYGCRVDNEAVRGAWLVLSHQAWARHLRVLAHRGERAEAVARLVEYTALYEELATAQHGEAQGWMLRGRLFHQALTDAIWAVNIGHTVLTLAEGGTEDLSGVLPLLDSLERAALDARAVLIGKGQLASNYTAWLNAAGAAAGRAAAAVRGQEWDGAKEWLEGDSGLYAHLRVAVAGDGWEWEGSTYYHGFVLRAALLALRGTDPAALPADVTGVLAGMTDVLASIATRGGILPALHDGPYLRAPLALEWLELVALAQQLVPSAALDAVAGRARAELGAGDDGLDRELGGWFTGPPLAERPAPGALTLFTTAGYAVLRVAGVHALLDFGPHGGSHGHRDKLSLYLYGDTTPWQPDPGQVPYAHAEFRDLYASTEAHPAFRVDGLEQAECTGALLGSDDRSVTAEVTTAYEGVRGVRRIAAGEGYLVDLLTVTADESRRITAQLRPGTALDVQVQAAGPVRTTWYGDETLHGWHTHRADVPVRPVTAPGPGPADDPQRMRTRVDFTADTGRVTFASVYQAASAGPAVTDVHLDDDGLTVCLADGSTARFLTED